VVVVKNKDEEGELEKMGGGEILHLIALRGQIELEFAKNEKTTR
jgi:hypothetical protein